MNNLDPNDKFSGHKVVELHADVLETKINKDLSFDKWITNGWQVGSKVEIYSQSSDCWFEGDISRIFSDDEGEWLEVTYFTDNKCRSKQIPRDDIDGIRPYSKALNIYNYVYDAIKVDLDKNTTENVFYQTCTSIKKATDIDGSSLLLYLCNNVDEFKQYVDDIDSIEPKISRFTIGYINPPYLIEYGDQKYVLRKAVSPSWDAEGKVSPTELILKQYKIMDALKKHTSVPVPTMIHYCSDESIIGAEFYVMEFMDGRVFPKGKPDLPGMTKQDRQEIYGELINVIAKIHCVDYNKLGLTEEILTITNADYKWTKAGYLQKFDNTKTAQHEINKNSQREITASEFENCMKQYKYLTRNPKTFTHGDYHLGNIIWHPTENKIIAVVDWEFGTVGDPLIGLAYYCADWNLKYSKKMIFSKQEVPAFFRGFDMDSLHSLQMLGIPSEKELLQKYVNCLQRSNVEQMEMFLENVNNDWNFYGALYHYRLLKMFHDLHVKKDNPPLMQVFPINTLDYLSILGNDVLNRNKIKISVPYQEFCV